MVAPSSQRREYLQSEDGNKHPKAGASAISHFPSRISLICRGKKMAADLALVHNAQESHRYKDANRLMLLR